MKKKRLQPLFPQRSPIGVPLFLSFLFQPFRHIRKVFSSFFHFDVPLWFFSPAPTHTFFFSRLEEKKECRNYKQHLHFPNAFNVIFVNIRVSTGADLCGKIWKNLAMERIRYFHFFPAYNQVSFFFSRVFHFFPFLIILTEELEKHS